MKYKNYILILLILLQSLTGCSPPPADLYATVEDGGEIVEGSNVVWRGVKVGEVSGISYSDEKFHIAIRLHENFREKIRSDARVKIAKNFRNGFAPEVRIIGGKDAQQPVLKRGDKISEADRFWCFSKWQSWLGKALPEAQEELTQIIGDITDSPQAKELEQHLHSQIERAAEALENGEATLDDAAGRIQRAVEAARVELQKKETE